MFGIDLFDAALMPSLFVALLAGIISFLSPCVLPIVPPYLAYMGGISMSEMTDEKVSNKPAVIAAIFFALGLSTVFIFLGFAASAFGQLFLQNQTLLAQISGGVIVVFGLHFLGLITLPFLQREARFDAGDRGGSSFGAYILGLAFAFGWTPCIGPILGAILALSAQEASITRGTMLLATYAIGLGVPFIIASVFINRAIGLMNRFKRHMGLIEKIMGGMLVTVGIMMMTGAFTRLALWLLETFPALAAVG
ncbi:cytochrome c biogenesis protein CcdA [Amylibacter sp. SFDW26]|uniref:cytochrome c biogenesis CcdA family protein n=1 Tax=Amylibacter sp. SFDW26 TaxID=2652722 RepID=UPI0012613CA5|nr:cytochrome c biogenesis protein CcdA [Amylibacter sp. SFDW26]KAB7616049.1 cytochrome c biogenesis protein CcdA [Amylibacter sp. SFDW26]